MPGPAANSNPSVADTTPRSVWRSRAVWSAVAALAATRIYLYGFMIAGVSDVTVYFPYAVAGVDRGLLPYKDIPVEYPPVAYWTIRFPRVVSDWRLPSDDVAKLAKKVDERTAIFAAGGVLGPDEELEALEKEFNRHLNHYDWGFRAQMLGADLVAFVLFGLMFARRHPMLTGWALWTYVITTSVLGYLLYDRLDIGLTMLFLVWAYCWLRADDGGSRGLLLSTVGYAALGIGVGYKLIPIVAVPFAFLVDVLRLGRDRRTWPHFICGAAVLLVTALGPFAYYYYLVRDDLWRMFAYHADRGLQIESSYVTVLMLSQPWSELVCYYDYGSWNLRGRLEPWLLKASTWLLLAVMALLGLRSLATMFVGERYDRTAAVRMGFLAVAAATFLAKVLSPQYLIWSLPLLLWAAAEFLSPRGFKFAAIGSIVMAACTSFLFPCHYVDTMVVPPYTVGKPPDVEPFPPMWSLIHAGDDFLVESRLSPHWLPPTVLITRNLIMGAVTAAIAVAALRRVGPRERT
jgi:hypothetical protein